MEPKLVLNLEFEGVDKSIVKMTISDISQTGAEGAVTSINKMVASAIIVGADGKPVTACTKAYFVQVSTTDFEF
ncbi:MAG: hypothetical protein ACRDD8_11430 [Bacteroidales bacterium]